MGTKGWNSLKKDKLPAETIIGSEVTKIETPIRILKGIKTSTESNLALKNLKPKYLQYSALLSLKENRLPTILNAKAVNLCLLVYSHF